MSKIDDGTPYVSNPPPAKEVVKSIDVDSKVSKLSKEAFGLLQLACKWMGFSEAADLFGGVKEQTKQFHTFTSIASGETIEILTADKTPGDEKQLLSSYLKMLSAVKVVLEQADAAPEVMEQTLSEISLIKKGNDFLDAAQSLNTMHEENRGQVLIHFAATTTALIATLAKSMDQNKIATIASAFSKAMKIIEHGITRDALKAQKKFNDLKEETIKIVVQQLAQTSPLHEKAALKNDEGFAARLAQYEIDDFLEEFKSAIEDVHNELELLEVTKYFLGDNDSDQLEKVERAAAEVTLKINEAKVQLIAHGGPAALLEETKQREGSMHSAVEAMQPMQLVEWLNKVQRAIS